MSANCPTCGRTYRPDARPSVPITRRQREVLDYIRAFYSTHGRAPSMREVARNFGLLSLATVHEHITHLRDKGLLIDPPHNTSYTLIPSPAVMEGWMTGAASQVQP